MTKRFTATEKWDDPWFRKLNLLAKAFWYYVCDKCDNAGVWKIDFEHASFYMGETITNEVIPLLNENKERARLSKNGQPLDNTNTTVSLDKKQTRYVAAWNFMVPMNANDYVELMWFSNQANAQIHYAPAQTNPTRPAIPSLILTINQVS